MIFDHVNFKGYHDILYAKSKRQYDVNIYIKGVVDYILGNGRPWDQHAAVAYINKTLDVVFAQIKVAIHFGSEWLYQNAFTYLQSITF